MNYAEDILNSYPLSELEQLDVFGFNWLHATIMRDELEVCKLLVKNGFGTSIKTAKGETASDIAYCLGKWKFVRILSFEG
jgi:hypothetical protein